MPTQEETDALQTKPLVQSTQNWMNVASVAIVASVGFFSNAGAQFLRENPVIIFSLLGAANYLWRTFLTKDKIEGILKTK